MEKALSFWLDNRNCAGTKAAVIGDQVLVLYRDRYYVVANGVAQTRGGKPLRYSNSSLTAPWKNALKGVIPSPVISISESEVPELVTKPKRQRKKAENPVMKNEVKEQAQTQTQDLIENITPPAAKPKRKTDAKPPTQPTVEAKCPYCNTSHELPLEKGKNGKPFFIQCSKCNAEFAVRFVQVAMYQAQVAGFK